MIMDDCRFEKEFTVPRTALLLFSLIAFLQGCTNVAMSGAQALYDHHNIANTLNDQYITMKADRSLYLDTDKYKNTNVAVASFNGVVLIAGQVKSRPQAQEVEQIVKNIDGVNEVHNLVAISAPTSAMTRISDTWITTKIKAKLIAAKEIDPSQIKVVTENGTVYLMGIVQPSQADAAIYLARTTEGVQRVVKIFSYIKISKTVS